MKFSLSSRQTSLTSQRFSAPQSTSTSLPTETFPESRNQAYSLILSASDTEFIPVCPEREPFVYPIMVTYDGRRTGPAQNGELFVSNPDAFGKARGRLTAEHGGPGEQ
jgi:hypothetical protein